MEEISLIARRWIFTAVWMGIMLYACTDIASGNHTGSALHNLLEDFGIVLSENTLAWLNFLVRKGAHVTEFAILAALLWRDGEPLMRSFRPPFDFRLAGLVLVICMAFAALTEGIQRFYPSREPSIRDVLINTGGAVLGLLIIFLYRWKENRNALPKTAGPILLTSNLQLDAAPPRLGQEHPSLRQLKEALSKTRARICIVAGNLGTADRAAQWLGELKAATRGVKLILCLGNRDHWVRTDRHADFPKLASVREKNWRAAARKLHIPCLDFGNVSFRNLIVVGGYGHFDLGMKPATLELAGATATAENYRSGEFAGLACHDMKFIPNAGADLAAAAEAEASSLARRLDQALASGKHVLMVTHTVPFPHLLPQAETRSAAERFLDAYAGNKLVGEVLTEKRGKIELVVCGHALSQPNLKVINGVPCVGLGNEAGTLGFLLFDPARPGTTARAFRLG